MNSFSNIIIDKKAIRANIRVTTNLMGNSFQPIAVIKANAYSHGAINAMKILSTCGVKIFAVACCKEAQELLTERFENEILLLSFPSDIEFCIKNKIFFTVSSLAELNETILVAKQLKAKAFIDLKINSGMNRYGFKKTLEFCEAIQKILKTDKIVLHGVYTHFCSVRSSKIVAEKQAKKFQNFLCLIPSKLNPIVHIGGHEILDVIDKKFYKIYLDGITHIRVGLMLYGYGRKGLKKVLKIESKVVMLQKCEPNEVVGYGGKNKLKEKTMVAVVPFGYADGMPRTLGNGNGNVVICKKKCPIIGNICMDSFMVDVTSLPQIKVNEKVTIFTNATDWAKKLNTIEYEVLTNFNHYRNNYIYK
ncbi:MAG: alanine racemase [Clostridia bacterium]